MDGHRWGDSGACGAPRGPDLCSLAAVSLSDAQALRAAAPGGAVDFAPAAVHRAGAGAGGDATNRLRPAYDGDRRDRKSTRLNSSHLVISYAVFCLKKKNTKSKITPVTLLCITSGTRLSDTSG